MANGNPSPGWYQDPRDPAQVRWWDGGQWTHNTQAMPGAQPAAAQTPAAPAVPPAQPAPADPWGAAQQPQADAWGQQPQQQTPQPGPEAWGQPQAPQPGPEAWGQQPQAQPGSQGWGQQPQPGPEAWGQQPQAQPGSQGWGQQPQPQVPQPGGQGWGQPAQPQAEGGWQQPGAAAWGSAVAPGPVPQGLAAESPVGQANVFPTAETVDPITGMPVGSQDGGSTTSGKKLLGLVAVVILVGLAVVALLWFFLFRSSGGEGEGTSGQIDTSQPYTGPVDPACADLGAALTADDLSSTVALRLNDVAVGKDLEENEAYFQQLGRDIKPIMDQYASTCIASVSAGDSPEFYRTFVETFESSVADGEAVATDALDSGGGVSSEDADRLRAEASKLEASAEAVVATSDASVAASPSPTGTGDGLLSDEGESSTTAPSPLN